MRGIGWYVRRLGSMSAGEIAWRSGAKARDAFDRLLLPLRQRPPALDRLVTAPDAPVTAPHVLGEHLARGEFRYLPEEADKWRSDLVAHADRILDNRLSLFDLRDHDLGPAIDWNYEYKAGRKTPMRPASTIDYRNHDLTGDCKFAWEPSRHYQLVVLGRAYRVTGDERYATAAIAQIESWIDQCPFGMGMNWRSGLELGLRLINWVYALQLLDGSRALTPAAQERIVGVAHQHMWEISRKYSRYSSANNHLVGEAAGVFIAASYFAGLKKAKRWANQSRDILTTEIERQTYPDGGTREQATGYHLFSLEFFLLAGLVARHGGDDFPPSYWHRLERMIDFAAALSDGSDEFPMLGDADDGYVLDLGSREEAVSSWLSIGAILFERPDLKAHAGGFSEAALWLLGPDGRRRFDALAHEPESAAPASRALVDSGIYVLSRGQRSAPDRISALLDCGELGYLSIAAHGHADALSLMLRVGGVDVLVDPGTYDYFTYPAWRNYFRSTRAHNTVVVDDTDQSEMLGPFLWGQQAKCRVLEWTPTSRGGTIVAEHDGYRGLSDPVIHRRTVTLSDHDNDLVVRDDITATGPHTVAIHWHFSEHCRVEALEGNRFEARFGNGAVTLTMDSSLESSTVRGSEVPILGWVSRGYHRKVPITTVVGRRTGVGSLSMTTHICVRAAPHESGEAESRLPHRTRVR